MSIAIDELLTDIEISLMNVGKFQKVGSVKEKGYSII